MKSQATWSIDVLHKVIVTYRNHTTGFVHEVGNSDIGTLEVMIEYVLQEVMPGEDIRLNGALLQCAYRDRTAA